MPRWVFLSFCKHRMHMNKMKRLFFRSYGGLAITLILILTAALTVAANGAASLSEKEIQEGWQFRQVGTETWHSATVPGCVHTDLLANGLIEDPFFRDNEKGLQWIGKTDWEYRTTFDVTAGDLLRNRQVLVFEGLDTYADVSLNGMPLISTDNMFRVWKADVAGKLKAGKNELHIRFRSPINEILPLMAKLDYQIPAPNDQGEITSPYTRKAPYQYGWDWGPRFVTSGVWRPVKLRTWNDARIEDLNIIQNEVTAAKAKLTAEVEVDVTTPGSYRVMVREGEWSGGNVFELKSGTTRIRIEFEIDNPRLWYPVGLGKQELYNFSASLSGGETMLDTAEKRTGLRSVELRQKLDQWGKSFEFVINGIPVFGKGGNWIPADSFPTRVTKEKYRHLLTSFRDANMNMIRVWGGGIYEEDYFYDLADELGLLIWQDFMFGVSMYPGDDDFLENVRGEAVDNVKRLRNHPSIILWCGNNESETAWQHWGWKERLPDELWENYKKIFLRLLPEVVEKYDPTRSYWSSSPSSDLEEDAESQKSGDLHYWAVWHASKPFSEYRNQFPRFMSEYGFQSFPDIDTVRMYTSEDDRKSIETPVMLAHQRHPRGNQLIREYMLREYEEPKDFESFLYVSQVLQAEGIRLGTEHLRRIRPRNMGALYWQLNDCWPVASWASTDYFGRWKALHFYARRFFSHHLVSPVEEEGKIRFYVVSDDPAPLAGKLRINVFDLSGAKLTGRETDVEVAPVTSRSYAEFTAAELLGNGSADNAYVLAELIVGGRVVSTNDMFLKPFKELKLTEPKVTATVTKTAAGFRIRLESDKLARAVYLRAEGVEGRFTDNFFNLLPGHAVETEFLSRSTDSAESFRSRLAVRTMVDAFDK